LAKTCFVRTKGDLSQDSNSMVTIRKRIIGIYNPLTSTINVIDVMLALVDFANTLNYTYLIKKRLLLSSKWSIIINFILNLDRIFAI
jgi:hypothetical protein